jgi:hypothetical protein
MDATPAIVSHCDADLPKARSAISCWKIEEQTVADFTGANEMGARKRPAKPLSRVHRHSHSAIDFDFYLARATALRSQAKRDAATLTVVCVSALAIVGALAVAVSFAATPIHLPNGQSALAQTGGHAKPLVEQY